MKGREKENLLPSLFFPSFSLLFFGLLSIFLEGNRERESGSSSWFNQISFFQTVSLNLHFFFSLSLSVILSLSSLLALNCQIFSFSRGKINYFYLLKIQYFHRKFEEDTFQKEGREGREKGKREKRRKGEERKKKRISISLLPKVFWRKPFFFIKCFIIFYVSHSN